MSGFFACQELFSPPPLSLLETMIRDWISASLFKNQKAFLSVDFESVGEGRDSFIQNILTSN